jgi:hypothetical protein
MYILPYVLEDYKQSNSEFAIRTLWLFLTQQGTALWETDEKGKVSNSFVVKEYLHANGIYGTVKCVKHNTLFYQVDTKKTNLDNFYMWNDESGNDEVWRPFFWIREEQQHWGWKEQTQQVTFGNFGSLDMIWTTILS